MKTNFLYVMLLSVLFLACKGKTDQKPVTTSNSDTKNKAGAQIEIAKGKTTTAKFLSLSDVHINGDMTETQFGNVSGTQLWSRTKTKIEAVVKQEQPKFMVYLGDLPAYIDSERAQNTHLMLENLRSLQIGIPILYLPGNNDSLEGDYHSFTNGNGNSVLTEDENVSNNWPIINSSSTVIRAHNLDFNKEFGYYSVDLVDNGSTLKVIALNTVIFSNKKEKDSVNGKLVIHPMYNSKQNAQHEYVTGDDGISQQQATQDQMTWFETTMQGLGPNDRVMLMMHIPIGLDSYGGKPMWNQALTFKDLSGTEHSLHNGFIDIIEKYKPNITGLLNGHTHTDGLRRIYKSHNSNQSSDMISFSISTPGIAVNHDNNPAFKIFTYNSSNFDLLDFKTYYASPTNTAQNGDFKYDSTSTYTFSSVYGVTNPNVTIFSTLANESNADVIQHVNETLGAMSNQDVKMVHDDAVDVHKN
ncbi:metallophosphoesterase [uncultured Kordia sp.]|uniref:metallophosphoesterase n=1 Tax=uncultured Kordia sp. TaxID=507699 RepID=UPI0026358294|nr:metallophosphoesterase [uncultured Kordia sp.]